MIRLVLIRHAKSSWAVPGQPDRLRGLNDRGRRDAPRIGSWLAAQRLVPGHALVSSAVRTRETWALMAPVLGDVPVTFAEDLYEAAPGAILRILRTAPSAGTIAVIGHNPGIGEAARRFLAAPPADPAFEKYPTAATAAIGFEAGAWHALDWGAGWLEAFVTPKTLG